MRGRRLAFDYGDVRIGVAISDPDSIICSPLPFLLRKNPSLLDEIQGLVQEYEPITIFIGLPKHLSGNEGSSAEKVHAFAISLEKFAIPVVLVDERLSTVSAAQKLREAGRSARESKSLIDSMAAVSILEQGISLAKD
ncbi:COG0816 Predicted endonuclease involved in recombination (possible Holliday junction resolvase in Mycoplasmas and B. subtilis) [Candidatus Nanopelagicaceae bacterium]